MIKSQEVVKNLVKKFKKLIQHGGGGLYQDVEVQGEGVSGWLWLCVLVFAIIFLYFAVIKPRSSNFTNYDKNEKKKID